MRGSGAACSTRFPVSRRRRRRCRHRRFGDGEARPAMREDRRQGDHQARGHRLQEPRQMPRDRARVRRAEARRREVSSRRPGRPAAGCSQRSRTEAPRSRTRSSANAPPPPSRRSPPPTAPGWVRSRPTAERSASRRTRCRPTRPASRGARSAPPRMRSRSRRRGARRRLGSEGWRSGRPSAHREEREAVSAR